MRALFWLTVFFIIYGSLYPFSFQITNRSIVDFILFRSMGGESGFSDIVGNIVLFMPYGLLGLLAFRKQGTTGRIITRLLAGGLILAWGVQLLQIYVPARTPSLTDVGYNMIGLLVGMAAFPLAVKLLAGHNKPIQDMASPPLVLLLFWLGAELGPFVPTLDIGLVYGHIKSLVFSPIEIFPMLVAGGIWIVVFALMDRLTEGPLSLKLRFLVLGGIFMAQIVIVQTGLSWENIIGGIAAILLTGPGRIGRKITSPPVLLGITLTIILYEGLKPFSLADHTRSFALIPFSGALNGNMILNLIVMMEKVFFYGAALWFLKELGTKRSGAALLVFLIILMIELSQIFLVRHTPEITDPLLVIGIAILLKRLPEPTNIFGKTGPPAPPIKPPAPPIKGGK